MTRVDGDLTEVQRNDLAEDWSKDNYTQRIRRLRNRNNQVRTVGIALTAFVLALAAGDAASAVYAVVPGTLRATVFTLIVIAGASLGSAYVRYEDEIRTLSDLQSRAQPTDGPGHSWPTVAERFWHLALISTVVAAAAFVVAAWWAA